MAFEENDLTIYTDIEDSGIISLNIPLIKEQRLSVLEMLNLISLHKKRLIVIDKMKRTGSGNVLMLHGDGKTIKNIDLQLQKNWRFAQCDSYHIFWELPHCTCPKMDNRERYGVVDAQIYSAECPVHSKLG